MDSRPACDPGGGNVLGEALTGQPDLAPLLASGCALVGLREATRAEARFIRERELLALTMEDVDLLDVRDVMRRALATVTGLGHGFALCLHGSVINDMRRSDRRRLSATEPAAQLKAKNSAILDAFARILGNRRLDRPDGVKVMPSTTDQQLPRPAAHGAAGRLSLSTSTDHQAADLGQAADVAQPGHTFPPQLRRGDPRFRGSPTAATDRIVALPAYQPGSYAFVTPDNSLVELRRRMSRPATLCIRPTTSFAAFG